MINQITWQVFGALWELSFSLREQSEGICERDWERTRETLREHRCLGTRAENVGEEEGDEEAQGERKRNPNSLWVAPLAATAKPSTGAHTPATHDGQADQWDQGFLAHGPAQGRQERQDQAQQGCGEVQSQVQQVPLHLMRLRHRQGRQVEAISSSRSHCPRLVRRKMALLSLGWRVSKLYGRRWLQQCGYCFVRRFRVSKHDEFISAGEVWASLWASVWGCITP